jgi:hypothetical protein
MRAPVTALVLWSVAAAYALGTDLEAFRRAAAGGDVGTVTGRAFAERRRPAEAEQPLVGTVVTLLPRSAELVGRLETIKARARDSQRDFLDSATAIRQAREGYERTLWEAGFPELVLTTVVDPTGAFGFADVPAGEWMLIASRSVFVDKASPRATPRELGVYTPRLRLIGYDAVSVWLRELPVSRGRPATVELGDRGVWFTGVVEERVRDAGP